MKRSQKIIEIKITTIIIKNPYRDSNFYLVCRKKNQQTWNRENKITESEEHKEKKKTKEM